MSAKPNIVVLPDAKSIVNYEEQRIFSDLVEMKSEIEELTEQYEAQRIVAKKIVEEKQIFGLLDKTFVLNGTTITHNTRKDYGFSQAVEQAEKAVRHAQEVLKRLKAKEVKDGTAMHVGTTTYLSISCQADLEYNRENGTWIATFRTNSA